MHLEFIMKKKFKKIAIIHDVFIEKGGAERVLASLVSMFPDADVFIPLLSDENRSFLEKRTKGKIYSSFFNHIPFIHSASIILKPFLYWYWETLDLAGYDLVISSSHSFSSKGVITSSEKLHVSYIHTPPRYLYAEFNEARILENKFFKYLLTPLLSWMRQKDFIAAQRPDILIANSIEVQKRIKKYYRRDSKVIYPPVSAFSSLKIKNNKKEYYVCFSRLAKQKGMDLIIKSFNKMGKKLVVVGEGSEKKYLQSIANKNITFLGYLSDKKLSRVFSKAKGLVYASIEEDFGMVPVESLSMGVPVIAFYSGGVKEVVNNKTGVFFKERTTHDVVSAIKKFEKKTFLKKDCVKRAANFSESKFKKSILKVIGEKR
jgi:glycosyltransferase involved in cell wall biosynthesis